MKKLALTIICALATTGAALAQGWVSFSTPGNAFTAATNATAFSPLFGGGLNVGGTTGITAGSAATGLVYDYTLLFQANNNNPTDTHVWDGTWTDTGLTATNTATLGRAQASGASGLMDLHGTFPQWANGTTNAIVMVGWSANLGTSWAQVSAELATAALSGNRFTNGSPNDLFFGESNFGFINPNAGSPGALLFGVSATPNGLPIMSLATQLYLLPVPEPTTVALIGLGGLALLAFRRRQ